MERYQLLVERVEIHQDVRNPSVILRGAIIEEHTCLDDAISLKITAQELYDPWKSICTKKMNKFFRKIEALQDQKIPITINPTERGYSINTNYARLRQLLNIH